MKIKDEKGVAMVEATIYMPIVLCVVMSLIYLALFNMQEYMMLYEPSVWQLWQRGKTPI